MADIELVSDYLPGGIGKIIEMHGTYYTRHWNLGPFFEAKAAVELGELLSRYNPARDGFWFARDGDKIVGSVVIDGQKYAEEGARLRWFILDEAYQGKGIGKNLLDAALGFCREKNFKRVYLTTFGGLDSARHLYEKAGFRLCEEEEGNYWGSPLLEQKFELWLR